MDDVFEQFRAYVDNTEPPPESEIRAYIEKTDPEGAKLLSQIDHIIALADKPVPIEVRRRRNARSLDLKNLELLNRGEPGIIAAAYPAGYEPGWSFDGRVRAMIAANSADEGSDD